MTSRRLSRFFSMILRRAGRARQAGAAQAARGLSGAYRFPANQIGRSPRVESSMASLRAASAGLLLGSLLVSCSATRAGLDRAALTGSGRLTLMPAEYAQLAGWSEDRL